MRTKTRTRRRREGKAKERMSDRCELIYNHCDHRAGFILSSFKEEGKEKRRSKREDGGREGALLVKEKGTSHVMVCPMISAW